jgi:hypothetical protein
MGCSEWVQGMILKTAFRGIRESVMDSLRIQRGVRGIGKLPSYCDQMPFQRVNFSRWFSPDQYPGVIFTIQRGRWGPDCSKLLTTNERRKKMGLMNEMITEADWKRREKGLPPVKKPEILIPEPEPPVVENQIYFKDLFSEDKEITNVQGHMKSVKNVDGMTFVGFNLAIFFKDDSQMLSGWLSDCDFQKLKLALRGTNLKTGIDLILG